MTNRLVYRTNIKIIIDRIRVYCVISLGKDNMIGCHAMILFYL